VSPNFSLAPHQAQWHGIDLQRNTKKIEVVNNEKANALNEAT